MSKKLKILTLVLVLVLAVPLLFMACLQLKLWYVQHEAKERLEKESLTTIQLQKQEFFFINGKSEIRIGKHFFDYKSYQKNHDGSYTFTGIFDVDEQKIHQVIEDMHQKSDAAHHATIQKWIQFTWFQSFSQFIIHHPWYTNPTIPNNKLGELCNGYKWIAVPPPNLSV